MKRKFAFFAKALLVLALVVAFLFLSVMPQYTQGYNAALLDKAERIKAIEGPKIVLVGNSNLAFGIDSQRIEEAMGMPVVNMGLHGGIGNAFHEQMALMNVTPGDIYILCPTDYDDDDTVGDPSLVWITLEDHFSLWGLLRLKDIPTMVGAYSSYLKKAIELWAADEGNLPTEDMYTRGAFNEYGDNAFPRPQPAEPIAPFAEQRLPEIGDAAIDRMNALHRTLSEKGATLLLASFPIASGEYTPLVSEYDALWTELTQRLEFPLISYFPEYMLNYNYFYDTLYHLTDDGVQERTRILIDDLRLWMENR